MNTLTAGTVAPNFSLSNQFGETIELAKLKSNKVLVYFYPKASTPGCTVQAKALRDSMDDISAKNVHVLGISPDPVKRLSKFSEKESLNFSLLADEDHKVAEAYGVWGLKKFMGKEYDGIHRISFLIDENGKIEKVFDKFKTKDHHEHVLAAIA